MQQATTMQYMIYQVFGMPAAIYRTWAGTARHAWFTYLVWLLVCVTIGTTINAVHTGQGYALGEWIGTLLVAAMTGSLLANVRQDSKWKVLTWCPMFGQSDRLVTWADSLGNVSENDVLRGSTVQDSTGEARPAARGATTIHIGGIAIDPMTEVQHILIGGTTGSGKTQAINGIFRTIRERNQAAIVADVGGGFLSTFGRPKSNDLVLNPFDARDAGWNPFLEIQTPYDAARLAKSTIADGTGEGEQWTKFAQYMLSAVLQKQKQSGEMSVRRLLYLMNEAPALELAEVLAGTRAAVLTQPGNERMLSNTRVTAAPSMEAWDYLAEGGTFSIRDWVRAVAEEDYDGWLFLPYRDDQAPLLRPMISTWCDIALVEGLALEEKPNRRVWYGLDEVDSLGKVNSLKDGLTKLRKRGGSVVAALQAISQARTTYGDGMAETILANFSTRLVMRCPDGPTAKYFEEELGTQEVRRFVETRSTGSSTSAGLRMGSSSSSTNSGESEQRLMQATVLASEIQGLPDLTGYLTAPSSPIRKVKIDYQKMPETMPTFIPKAEGAA